MKQILVQEKKIGEGGGWRERGGVGGLTNSINSDASHSFYVVEVIDGAAHQPLYQKFLEEILEYISINGRRWLKMKKLLASTEEDG